MPGISAYFASSLAAQASLISPSARTFRAANSHRSKDAKVSQAQLSSTAISKRSQPQLPGIIDLKNMPQAIEPLITAFNTHGQLPNSLSLPEPKAASREELEDMWKGLQQMHIQSPSKPVQKLTRQQVETPFQSPVEPRLSFSKNTTKYFDALKGGIQKFANDNQPSEEEWKNMLVARPDLLTALPSNVTAIEAETLLQDAKRDPEQWEMTMTRLEGDYNQTVAMDTLSQQQLINEYNSLSHCACDVDEIPTDSSSPKLLLRRGDDDNDQDGIVCTSEHRNKKKDLAGKIMGTFAGIWGATALASWIWTGPYIPGFPPLHFPALGKIAPIGPWLQSIVSRYRFNYGPPPSRTLEALKMQKFRDYAFHKNPVDTSKAGNAEWEVQKVIEGLKDGRIPVTRAAEATEVLTSFVDNLKDAVIETAEELGSELPFEEGTWDAAEFMKSELYKFEEMVRSNLPLQHALEDFSKLPYEEAIDVISQGLSTKAIAAGSTGTSFLGGLKGLFKDTHKFAKSYRELSKLKNQFKDFTPEGSEAVMEHIEGLTQNLGQLMDHVENPANVAPPSVDTPSASPPTPESPGVDAPDSSSSGDMRYDAPSSDSQSSAEINSADYMEPEAVYHWQMMADSTEDMPREPIQDRLGRILQGINQFDTPAQGEDPGHLSLSVQPSATHHVKPSFVPSVVSSDMITVTAPRATVHTTWTKTLPAKRVTIYHTVTSTNPVKQYLKPTTTLTHVVYTGTTTVTLWETQITSMW